MRGEDDPKVLGWESFNDSSIFSGSAEDLGEMNWLYRIAYFPDVMRFMAMNGIGGETEP